MWVHQEKAQRNVVLFYLSEDKWLDIENVDRRVDGKFEIEMVEQVFMIKIIAGSLLKQLAL